MICSKVGKGNNVCIYISVCLGSSFLIEVDSCTEIQLLNAFNKWIVTMQKSKDLNECSCGYVALYTVTTTLCVLDVFFFLFLPVWGRSASERTHKRTTTTFGCHEN
jgi:hypothetical protein